MEKKHLLRARTLARIDTKASERCKSQSIAPLPNDRRFRSWALTRWMESFRQVAKISQIDTALDFSDSRLANCWQIRLCDAFAFGHSKNG